MTLWHLCVCADPSARKSLTVCARLAQQLADSRSGDSSRFSLTDKIVSVTTQRQRRRTVLIVTNQLTIIARNGNRFIQSVRVCQWQLCKRERESKESKGDDSSSIAFYSRHLKQCKKLFVRRLISNICWRWKAFACQRGRHANLSDIC